MDLKKSRTQAGSGLEVPTNPSLRNKSRNPRPNRPAKAQGQDLNPLSKTVAQTPDQAMDHRTIIKKYANRRLYDTASSSYVTLDHLRDMVKSGADFVVLDAKTEEDITRQVLGQIIFDEESRGQNLLPVTFLRQLIQFYGNQMQGLVPPYLELSLSSFAKQQNHLQNHISEELHIAEVFQAKPVFALFEEQIRQNCLLFERTFKMFTPFGYVAKDPEAAASTHISLKEPQSEPGPDLGFATKKTEKANADAIVELKNQMAQIQKRIAELSRKL